MSLCNLWLDSNLSSLYVICISGARAFCFLDSICDCYSVIGKSIETIWRDLDYITYILYTIWCYISSGTWKVNGDCLAWPLTRKNPADSGFRWKQVGTMIFSSVFLVMMLVMSYCNKTTTLSLIVDNQPDFNNLFDWFSFTNILTALSMIIKYCNVKPTSISQ